MPGEVVEHESATFQGGIECVAQSVAEKRGCEHGSGQRARREEG